MSAFLGVSTVAAVGWMLASAAPTIAPERRLQSAPIPALIDAGRYLAIASDCEACHTASGGKPFAGGLALETPFGKIFASNITPDEETGIGLWSEDAFTRALRQGISRDGHNLYPAMPYPSYTRFSDDDIRALKAYFDSIAPVRQKVPDNQLRFPFGFRPLLRLWNGLFFRESRFEPLGVKSADWNRGAYLVQGAGHCSVCHSGKNMLGGDSDFLEGGELLGWYAPELSGNHEIGLGGWPVAHIAQYLKSGRTRESIANGPMREVVEKSTGRMKDADLSAIVTYIVDLPGSGTKRQPVAVSAPAAGAASYERYCSACHSSTGRGVHAMVPRLADSSSVRAPNPASLIQTVLRGGHGGTHMPAFGKKLTDRQIADLLTYVRNSWANRAAPVDAATVRRYR